ncbi:MAG: TVP38/TMEM64 family protein [Gemmataceae bacterium]
MANKRWVQFVLGLLWAGLGVSFLILWWWSDIPLLEVPERLNAWLIANGLLHALGLVYLLYLLRPLVLFPSTIMGILSGLTFGPLIGCLVVTTGELLGSSTAFLLTRYLGRSLVEKRAPERLAHWDRRLSQHGFIAVCLMRMALLPFDSVSFACGLSGIRLRDFVLGTLLGGASFYLGVSLLGASGSVELSGSLSLGSIAVPVRWVVLASSILSFLLSLVLAWRFRRVFREGKQVVSQTQ